MARPNLTFLKNVVLVITGIPCGFLAAATGTSAGLLALPLAGYLLGAKALKGGGTIDVVSLVCALAALVGFGQQGDVSWRLALLFMVAQIVGAALALKVGYTARSHLGLLRTGAAVAMVLGLAITAASHAHGLHRPTHGHGTLAALAASVSLRALLLGVVCGIVSEAFDLGGLLVPMAATFALGLPVQWAVGTGLAALIPLYAVIVPARIRMHDVAVQPAVWLSIGGLFGALYGGQVAASHFAPGTLIALSGGVYCAVGVARFLITTRKN
jgi:uncharacterized membrane protein YfcA